MTSTALMGPPSYELWDDSGTPSLLGSGTGVTSTSSANVDSVTFTNVTYAMLATLRVRIYAHQGTAPKGAIQNVNWVNLTANITPAANTALLAHATGAARNAQAAVGVSAVLATGAGAALNASPPTPVTLATGTGAALGAAAAVGVTAVLATGAGAALNASVRSSATAATGTGAALNPAAAIGVNATLAPGRARP